MTDDRADAIVPTAAALIAAVRQRDPNAVAAVLDGDIDWQALAVVLADNIGRVNDLRLMHDPPTQRPRTWRTCAQCGSQGRRRTDLCLTCHNETLEGSPTDLKRGRWVNRGGVQKWIPNQETGAA